MTDLRVLPDSTSSSPTSKTIPALMMEEINRRANELWIKRQPGDRQLQDWLEAEFEIALNAAMNGQFFEARERIAKLFAERQEAERRLVVEHAVSSILTVSGTVTDAVPKLVKAIGECFDWDVGAAWILDRDANLLRCLGFWHHSQVEVPAFERDTRLRTFVRGDGIPGRVWASESFVWILDMSCDPNLPRASIAAEEDLHGAIAFPVHNGVEFLGVLAFFSREIHEPDQRLIETMASIGSQISQFIERRSAERRLLIEQHERRVGREIQQSLLPKTMPCLSGFEISGKSLAPNVVGGDCFYFIPLPTSGRNCLGVLVADASGHDIGAALLTVQTCAYLRGLALTNSDVGQLLTLTNQCLSTDPMSSHFVTAFLMSLDPCTRSLNYTGAGHLPAYVLGPQGQTRAILLSTGIPLGIDPTVTFCTSSVSLKPGDLVLLNTDGITEAASADHELFGIDRTLSVVRQHQQRTPDEILTALFAAANEYSNDNCLDDMTAVIIKVKDSA